MSENRYKIIVFGKKIYRELELSNDEYINVKIGTTKNCQLRFNKDLFFEEFEIDIVKTKSSWQANCSGNICFTTDGVMKLFSKDLQHGDEIIVKYQKSYNVELFRLNFIIDFDGVEKNYERVIDITGRQSIEIGGNDKCDIYIKDSLLGKDSITLSRNNNEVTITDNNSKYGVYINGSKAKHIAAINDFDFFMVVGYSFYLRNGKLYTSKSSSIEVKKLSFVDVSDQESNLMYPKFNRNTRIKFRIPKEPVNILVPQKLTPPPKGNLIMQLVPALAMLVLTVALRGVMGGGGTFVIYSAATMSIGMIMSVVSIVHDKKQYKKDIIEREAKYNEYIAKKETEIKSIREKELEILKTTYKSTEDVIKTVGNFSRELFDKDKEDSDFLEVRVGTGVINAIRKIEYSKQESIDTNDPLMEIPERLENKYRYLNNAPIISRFSKADAIGIVGLKVRQKDFLKNITLDIAVRHFYSQVKIFYMFNKEDAEQFSWVRWLRHVDNESIGVRNIICDEESKNLIFEHLYIELSKRETSLSSDSEKKYDTYYVVFVFDNKGIKNHPISKYIENANVFGFTFVFFEEDEDLLPRGCTEVIKLSSTENTGELISSENGEEKIKFSYMSVSDKIVENISLKLASVYVDEVSLESELTKNISLFDLLNIMSIDDLDISSRWDKSEVYKSMAAPLGVKTKNTIVYLDLNEKKHGPHGLVAGTTGSGKSEILQSYILSMATLFHPYEVGFVIIDFKGGGMVNQFKDLPHLIGSITNIDGREIERSLLSIKAELRKRQEMFSQYGVNHIDSYIKKFKAGEAKKPLPHLILIVDEFAELKSEQPDFMKELISAARIGRSLGVHLILATQKPSGVVDDQIWSNSKFKLCLKVQNQSDSNEVLKSPLASEIKEPGRAYFQVGNNEVFELFQSAYSGAPAVRDDMGNNKEFEINEVSLWGKRTTVLKQEKKKNSGSSATQLEALVKYINEYCLENNIERLPGICLPPLPDVILLSDGDKLDKNNIYIEAAIGLYDDPAQQLQAPVRLNISEGNLFIVGSSQFGKTSLLQTIIRTVAENYSPEEVNMYILDFASMILKNFQELKHVGGVITSSDDEKLKTFTNMMFKEIEYRKSVLSKLGISSFVSYKEAGYKDMPQIIIFLDNMTAFKEMYSERDEELLNICREGVAVGITVIIANAQTTGIGYKYMANFSNRIALYCNDSSEYGSLFDRGRMQPKNIAGRALISIDKNLYEYQNYLAFTGEKEIDRVKDMRKFIEDIKLKHPNIGAKIIPEIPKILDMSFIKTNYGNKKLKPYVIPIGLNYETIDLETIDLLKESPIVIMGKEDKGKSNFIANIAQCLQSKILEDSAQVYIVDNIEKKLSFMSDYGFVERYSSLFNDLELIIEEVFEELQYRSEKVSEHGMDALKNEPLLLIINNNRDAMSSLCANMSAMEKYKKITTQFKNLKVCIIFNDVENAMVSFTSPELIKGLKEGKNAFLFDEIGDNKFFDLPINIARNYKKPLTLGDSYWLKSGEIKKIKTILKD